MDKINVDISLSTIDLFKKLLAQATVSATDPDFEEVAEMIILARKEIKAIDEIVATGVRKE